jgi:hypothetical protein
MSYSTKAPPFDRDRAERYRAEIARTVPVTEGDPAFLYWTEHRGLPAQVVLGCGDLRHLPSPIQEQGPTVHAAVSLLRPAPGAEPTAAEVAFVDILGHPAALERARMYWALTERGCLRAWFWAGGSDTTAIVAEGFGAKPLALLAAGVSGMVMGWGSRSWLRWKRVPAGVTKMVVVADRRPGATEMTAGGKPARDQHDRDYRDSIDHWLNRGVEVLVTPDPGALGKDADEILVGHGAEALRKLVEAAVPAQLSQDGWAFKLGLMTDGEYELARERLAREYAAAFGGEDGGKRVRLAFLDAMRRRGKTAVFMEAMRARRRRLRARPRRSQSRRG